MIDNEIYDLTQTGDEVQAILNNAQGMPTPQQLSDAFALKANASDVYTKNETYTKTEVNRLVGSPDQNYVTVEDYASLPATGSTDTIYRVANYDGENEQVDVTMYSEYAWNGTSYTLLCVKSQIGEVFDISDYNDATYADLSAALGADGANVPASIRRGGMSIKFIQSSDNKYVQYRLMAQSFTTDITQWQGVDDEPTARSNNLVESGGVSKELNPVKAHFKQIELNEKHQGQINTSTKKWQYVTGASNRFHCLVPVNAGDIIYVIGGGSVAYWLASYTTPVNDESADVIGNTITLTDNVAKTLTAPTNATYLYVYVQSSQNYYYPKYITFADNDDILEIEKNLNEINNEIDGKFVDIFNSESKVRTVALANYNGDITDKLNFVNGSIETGATEPDYTDNTCLVSNYLQTDVNGILDVENESNGGLLVIFSFLSLDNTYQTWSTGLSQSFSYPLNIANVKGLSILIRKSDSSPISITDISSIKINKRSTNSSDVINIQKDLYGNIELSKLEIHKGYIAKENGQWIWNNVNVTTRQHVVIPCVAGDVFEITSNDFKVTNIIFISAYNVVEDGLCGFVSEPTAPAVGETESYEVPSGAIYMYLQYNSSNDVYLPRVIRKVNGTILLNDIKDGKRNPSILSFNNEQEILQRLVNAKLSWSGRTPSFTMIHFSDMHNNQVNFDRIEEFATHYNEYLDLILHTGDSVGGSYTQTAPIPWNDNAKFLNVLGNHDCERANDGNPREGETELDGKYLAPRSAPYTKNFAPYIDNWGVTRPSGATTEMYYYKDYTTYGIRLICIDRYYWDNDQKQWLIDTLADAKTNSLEVIMASHEGAFELLTAKDASNPFDSLDYDLTGTVVMPEAVAAVKSFVDGGGTLICWLTGHMHADSFGMSTDSRYSGMLDICVSAAGKHLTNQEYSRPDGTKAMDLFNIYSIDVVKKRLSIVRIGADYDMYMRHKNSLVWDYANKQILYKD